MIIRRFRMVAALAGAACLLMVGPAHAQVTVWEKDAEETDDDVPVRSIDLFGYVQPRFSYEQHDTRDATYKWEPAPGFRIRRARFGAQASLLEWASSTIELDLAGDQVRAVDAFVNLAPLPELQVSMGQFRVPFSRQNRPTRTGTNTRGSS